MAEKGLIDNIYVKLYLPINDPQVGEFESIFNCIKFHFLIVSKTISYCCIFNLFALASFHPGNLHRLLTCVGLSLSVKLFANVTNYNFSSYSGVNSSIMGTLLING